MAKCVVFTAILLLCVFIKYGESVRCWVCTSELSNNCDPFDANSVRLEDCDKNAPSFQQNAKTACKTLKTSLNGENIVTRSCIWKSAEDKSHSCPLSVGGSNVVTTFCETCEYDGCNSGRAEKSGIGSKLKRILGINKD